MLSYGKHFIDDLGCTHSIDNLVLEYIVFSFNQHSVISSLASVFSRCIDGWNESEFTKTDMTPCSKFSWFRASLWGGGFYLQYGQYRDYDQLDRTWSEYPLLRIKFNPNKHLNTSLCSELFNWVRLNCDNGALVKFDYAIDVPCCSTNLVVSSRKEPGLFKGTRYFGQRNKHGRLKIYDKREESELPSDMTRVEWTFCFGKPIVFDDVLFLTSGPLPIPDFTALSPRTAALVRLVLMIRSLNGDPCEALAQLDPRTRKKIEPFTIGTGVRLVQGFDSLAFLLDYYCSTFNVSFSSTGVNPLRFGSVTSLTSSDDIESEDMSF